MTCGAITGAIDECLRALEILKDISGDLPPDDYSPRIVDEFMERVKWLPRNPEKDKKNRDLWRKISFLQATHHVEIEQLPRISESTVTKHVIRLSAFFSFCKRRRYMGHDNPFSGRTPKRKMTKGGATESLAERLPFDMQDLEQIFSSQLYKTRTMPHTFWPPLIALMTGARVNEISQLYLDDIVNDIPGKPDAWRFMILAKRTDQRVKNESALRSIPMHPRLIEMGFLCYLEDLRRLGHQRVFPSLGGSRWWSAHVDCSSRTRQPFAAFDGHVVNGSPQQAQILVGIEFLHTKIRMEPGDQPRPGDWAC